MSERSAENVQEELGRLRRWKAEALPVLSGLQRLGSVLALPLGASISDQAADAVVELQGRLDKVEKWLREATEAEWSELCWFDHHGHCQSHGFIDGPCSIPAIRDYFKEADRG